MIHDLLKWMDDYFGHDLTDIFISTTIIERGVGLACRAPELRAIAKYERPIALLLSTGFSKLYRHSTWSAIARNQAYGHVVTSFTGASLKELPEVRSLMVSSMNHIQAEIDRVERQRRGGT